MKKIFFILLFLCGLEMQAQKQYVTIYCYGNNSYGGNDVDSDRNLFMRGDISDNIVNKAKLLKSSNNYKVEINDGRKSNNKLQISNVNLSDVLSLFGEEGFEIDQSTLTSGTRFLIIMSRTKTVDTSNIKKVRKGDVNEDEQVDISDVVSVINIIADE